MRRIWCALTVLMLALGLPGCGEAEEASGGLFRQAAGLAEDAALLTVDGREVPAWRYLYWLTYNCDYLAACTGDGAPDWTADRDGEPLGDYVKRQALETAVLYATIGNWAERYDCGLTEADREDMEAEWTDLCARYGGEEACLAALGWMGLDREMADSFTGDYYCYAHLAALAREPEGPLAADEETLRAFAAEQGCCTVSTLFISDGGAAAGSEALAERRQRADMVLEKLEESAEPAAYFTTLAGLYGEGTEEPPEGVTFTPGDGQLEGAAEAAAAGLAVGAWSGAVAVEGGWVILLRRALDLPAVAAARFDARLQQAAQMAQVRLSEAYEALDVPAFYDRLTAAREALPDGRASDAFAAAAGVEDGGLEK